MAMLELSVACSNVIPDRRHVAGILPFSETSLAHLRPMSSPVVFSISSTTLTLWPARAIERFSEMLLACIVTSIPLPPFCFTLVLTFSAFSLGSSTPSLLNFITGVAA